MTQDFINCMTTILHQGFRLFTCFKLPGVNFTPAILFFGILSFSLAISVVHGILTITANGLRGQGHSDKAAAATKRSISRGE